MPGLVGIVSLDGLDAHRQEIQRGMQPMLQPLDGMTDGLTGDFIVCERGALGAVSLRKLPPPLACRQVGGSRVWLALHGTVFLDDAPNCAPRPPMAEVLLDRYLSSGLSAVCGLNGTYALAIFEEQTGRLTLVKDRYGYAKLFYWQVGSRLMFASEYKSIFRHPGFGCQLNTVAVADLFLYRAPAEDRTLFENIHALPPAGVLIYQDGSVTVSTTWKPAFPSPGAPEKRDEEYAAEMADRVRASIRRRALPGAALLITGGLDSRIVAGAYQQVAPQNTLPTVTVGQDSGGDVVLGRALARSLGFPHQHIPVDTTYLERFAALCTWKSEARNGSYAAWVIAAAPYFQQQDLQYVLTGLYGNFIAGTYYPPELIKARTHEQGLRVLEGSLYPYLGQLQAIMRPEIFRSAATESAGAIRRVYNTAESDHILQRSDAANFCLRVSRQATTEDSLGHAAMPLEPYLDHDVFDYAIGAIPPGARARGLIHPLLVLRHLPAAAQTPLNHTGRTLADDMAIRQSALRLVLDQTRARIVRRMVRDVLHSGSGKATPPSIPHIEAIRAGSRAFVTGLFAQAAYYDDLFDPRAVAALLENHISGRSTQYMTIDALVTLILWRKQFLS